MFDGVARRYDLLNHLLSLNLDRSWRRAAAAELPDSAERVLDLCGGTGDLSLALCRGERARRVICCDFSHAMLVRANSKFGRGSPCIACEGDGLRLPFGDGSFEAVTIGFGLRNFSDLSSGLREIHRVLRGGGRMVVLEFSAPTSWPLAWIYRSYLHRILPRIAAAVSGRSGPYGYLARTISEFPDPATLSALIRESGFASCSQKQLTGGIVAIHTALRG